MIRDGKSGWQKSQFSIFVLQKFCARCEFFHRKVIFFLLVWFLIIGWGGRGDTREDLCAFSSHMYVSVTKIRHALRSNWVRPFVFTVRLPDWLAGCVHYICAAQFCTCSDLVATCSLHVICCSVVPLRSITAQCRRHFGEFLRVINLWFVCIT